MRGVNLRTYLILLLTLYCTILSAQRDTIHLQNDNILVGEIKALAEGVITMKTKYSDKDFKIKFKRVKVLNIERRCLVVLTRGRRRFGKIATNEEGEAVITLDNGTVEKFPLSQVIALQEIEENFWRRFKGGIDLGYNITKSNNTRQFTIGGQLEYTGKIWLFQSSVNTLNSAREDALPTTRTDANMELLRLFNIQWYLLGDISFLSNTAQALDARISPSLGLGKLFVSSDRLYLGVNVGFTYNIEEFVDASLNKTSAEIFVGTTFNMYGFEDLSLNTGLKIYPSLSEDGRVRIDYDINLKYDLPWDFYIKTGFTFNYDNQPAVAGNDFDYIFNSGFGWEFK